MHEPCHEETRTRWSEVNGCKNWTELKEEKEEWLEYFTVFASYFIHRLNLNASLRLRVLPEYQFIKEISFIRKHSMTWNPVILIRWYAPQLNSRNRSNTRQKQQLIFLLFDRDGLHKRVYWIGIWRAEISNVWTARNTHNSTRNCSFVRDPMHWVSGQQT